MLKLQVVTLFEAQVVAVATGTATCNMQDSCHCDMRTGRRSIDHLRDITPVCWDLDEVVPLVCQ